MATRTADRVEALAALRLLEHCSRRDLTALARIGVDEAFPRGSVLTREGQTGGLAYVVLEGCAVARRAGRRIGELGPGEVVGELSVIDGGPRTATVTAETEIRALAIDGAELRKVLARSPRLTAALLRTLAERIREADRRVDLRA